MTWQREVGNFTAHLDELFVPRVRVCGPYDPSTG